MKSIIYITLLSLFLGGCSRYELYTFEKRWQTLKLDKWTGTVYKVNIYDSGYDSGNYHWEEYAK